MAMRLEPGLIAAEASERPTLDRLESALQTGSEQSAIRIVGPQGETLELPQSMRYALRTVAHYLAQGQAVTISPQHEQITTQEAADILNVSRPYIVKLLESGVIPFQKVGTHRRIRFDDLIAYKRQRDTERREGLAQLTQMSQEFGLDDVEE